MGKPSGRPHFLRQNHDSWTPPAVIFLDSETETIGEGEAETEQLRCWVAQRVRRRHATKAGEVSWHDSSEGWSAAEVVDHWASSDKTTWLYAHNVAFDLTTTRLAEQLAELGWELSSRHAVSGASPWLILHKGRQDAPASRPGRAGGRAGGRARWQHTLTIADSFSLMPVALEQIAAYSPFYKPPLPRQSADLEDWLERCRADVDILSWAVLSLMDWWEASDLGRWSVSGASCGWNSYRHRIGPKAVTIDPDPATLAFEHLAIYGGRRDVMRCGKLPPGRYAELDFSSAYPMIAATQLLPAKRIGRLTASVARSILAGRCRYGMVATVELETDVPRWPLRTLGRVFYPVGRFQTVLAGPEIAEAERLGCLRSVGEGYFYAMSNHMQGWARWVLSVQQSEPGDVPGPVMIAAKGWGRSVCGKWAQRGWSTEPFPGPPSSGWTYEDTWIAGSDARATICGLAGHYYLSMADQESEHEFPAILAHIEAHCRLRLARVIESAPDGAVIQCDTDGLMVSVQTLEDRIGDMIPWAADVGGRQVRVPAALEYWSELAEPLAMREKTTFSRAVVHGAQHVELDGRPRFSGVPRSAWQAGDNRWAARLWPGLSWQIQHGSSAGYVRPVQDYLVVGPYAAGWILASGSVRPVEAGMDAAGHSRVLPWSQTRWHAAGEQLAATQSGWSRGLAGTAAHNSVG